jgi:hypothetical protein
MERFRLPPASRPKVPELIERQLSGTDGSGRIIA